MIDLLASIPVADLGGKHAQHVALMLAARFTTPRGVITAKSPDLAEATGLSLATIHRALAILKHKGVLGYDKLGRPMMCSKALRSLKDREPIADPYAWNAPMDDWAAQWITP